ncbi:hypothetical protein NDU88_003762 [Pleurodeles waltl]|uniref:Uncharacterized protein n=1 Tax=Pleurodeles waltl TaxID=8319 RepID=A0AAV7SGU9_PLEWA|nr:hypothetical protein NDU88_003762 [Pleurodeles waltl]
MSVLDKNASLHEDDIEYVVALVDDLQEGHIISRKVWKDALCEDDTLQKVVNRSENGWPKERNLESDLNSFFQVADELSVVEGLLLRYELLVPPTKLREKLFVHAREGHQVIPVFKRTENPEGRPRAKEYAEWREETTQLERHRMADEQDRVGPTPQAPEKTETGGEERPGVDLGNLKRNAGTGAETCFVPGRGSRRYGLLAQSDYF